MRLQLVEPFAIAHHGVVTLDAAVRAGIPRRTFFRAVEGGQLVALYPAVARLVGSPPTREQAIAAAVLVAGPGAMASHRSAAYLWGVPRPATDPIDVILPVRSREAQLGGVAVHRPRDRRDLNPGRRQGIPTTNVLRLLCDLGAVDPAGVNPAVGHVLTAGLASPAALSAAIRSHGRCGRHGVPALRDALDDWLVDGEALDSELERRMHNLITRHALPAVQFHAIIHGYEVDFWVIDTPIVLECDGFEWHGKRRRTFESDRHRDAELTAVGYITVRFTWLQLTRQPQWVLAMIRCALARWSAGQSGRV